jgi:hypothetical protein
MKTLFIIGLCMLLCLVLVSADTETMFILGGDTETYFFVPVDNEIGLIMPGKIPTATGGGSSWPGYDINLSILPVNSQSGIVPTAIVVDNPGASLVNANWSLSLYDPRGMLVQRINFVSDLPSGRHIIYQNLSLNESLMQGLWMVDVVLNTDLQRAEDQKNFTVLKAGAAPLAILPITVSVVGVDLLIWIFLLVIVILILWFIFGKKRRKNSGEVRMKNG